MDPATRQKINELIQETDPVWAFERRKEYLKGLMTDLIVDWWYERQLHSEYVAEGKMLEDIITQEKMRGIIKQIVKHQNEIYYRRKAMKGEQVGVTPDEIARAKAHPFEDLIPFKNFSAMCPFHEGKSPALRLYRDNVVWCFACQKQWDTISFWMELNGRSFADSVRSLL